MRASAPAQKEAGRGRQGGYALITALIFFLSITTAVLAGLSDAVLREARVVRSESASKQSYFASESALEDVLYRMKKGKQVGTVGSLATGSTTAEYTVTTEADGTLTVRSTADKGATERTTQASVETGVGASFSYALQTGAGGIDLSSSHITGDAYTSGSIRSTGPSSVSGAAVAAGKSYSNLDSQNAVPLPPTNYITFGNSNVTQDVAQSFTVTQALSVTDFQIYVKKTGNPANATVLIVADDNGAPSGTVLASGTLSSSLVDVSYTWQDIPMSANPVLQAGATYWMVVDANTNSSSYYVVAANPNGSSNGSGLIGRQSTGAWYDTSPSGLDLYYKLSIGATESGIAGQDQYNTLAVGSAYAYRVTSVASAGPIYCQVGAYNNKSCDTSRADPALQDYPVSQSMISSWKSSAASGGSSSGNYTVGFAGDTLGPKKIVGNLTVTSGGILRVSGPIYVTGSVTVNGGASIEAASGETSYVIIADGTITITGGATVHGETGSHIMLVSTATNDPAITLNGGSDDTVLFAPYGGVTVSGGAAAKAAAAYHLTVTGGASVTYDPDMSQLNFSSGADGGPAIKSWKEVE